MTTTASLIESSEKVDDVWPKTVRCSVPSYLRVYFDKEVSLSVHGSPHEGFRLSPIQHPIPYSVSGGFTPIPGIKLEIVAEDGEEFPRVVGLEASGNETWYYLLLDEKHCIGIAGDGCGEVSSDGSYPRNKAYKPLPRGTKTTIEVFEGRIGEVVVEPPKEKWPAVLSDDVTLKKHGNYYSLPAHEGTDRAAILSKSDLKRALAYIESTEAEGA